MAVSVTFSTVGGENSVKVCSQRNVEPVTKLIPAIDNVKLKSSIQMRMEKPIPAAITGTPYAEAGEWSWC